MIGRCLHCFFLLDFDDNDTSDLTMTTIGSLASIMPLLVTGELMLVLMLMLMLI